MGVRGPAAADRSRPAPLLGV